MFPDAWIYDEPQKLCFFNSPTGEMTQQKDWDTANVRKMINQCDLALVCVPTNSRLETNLDRQELDMSVVEEVVSWLETPLILIKSALQPGTTDRLVKETGKKIATSVEMVGEGKYFVPYWKYPHTEDPTVHDFLIVGGEEETAKECADVLWQKMSPDTNIHLVSAIEAEICKLMENAWGANKVTFANVMYDVCQKLGANYTKVLQAWGADGRVEKMHMRVMDGKRGWKSKCYDKDIPALASLDGSGYLNKMVEVNKEHLKKNEERTN